MVTTIPTTTNAATETVTGLILAIDLGKYKSVACFYQAGGGEVRFHTLRTSRSEITQWIESHRPALIVIEACLPAGWVHDLCVELGVPCQVANTASEQWKFKHTKRKTDKDDAMRLAQLAALGQLPAVTVPPKAVREKRALIATRQVLVGQRVALQNRMRAILVGQGLAAPRGAKAWSEVGLQGMEALSRPLSECGTDELWRGLLALALTEYRQVSELVGIAESKLDALAKNDERMQLLDSIPGVGPRTAEAIVAHLHDPKRFQSGKQVSAYSGLVPRQYQSGGTDRRGRITKKGPALLRKLLVQCAWAMLRYNDWAKAVWQRLTKGIRSRRKKAVVALARKILVRCWAMLRDGTRWREQPTALAAATA